MAAKCLAQPWLLQSIYINALERMGEVYAVIIDRNELASTAIALAKIEKQRTGADLILVQLYKTESTADAGQQHTVTLYNVLLSDQGLVTQTLTLTGSTKRVQNQAALLGLDCLRRFLQHKLLPQQLL